MYKTLHIFSEFNCFFSALLRLALPLPLILLYLFDLNSTILSVVYVKLNNLCVILFSLAVVFSVRALLCLLSRGKCVFVPCQFAAQFLRIIFFAADAVVVGLAVCSVEKVSACDVMLNVLFNSLSPAFDFWQYESESAEPEPITLSCAHKRDRKKNEYASLAHVEMMKNSEMCVCVFEQVSSPQCKSSRSTSSLLSLLLLHHKQ